jgi:hypothetical protein
MTRVRSFGLPVTGFEEFLYSPIRQDDGGIPLSVLSVLARHDVDPWEEAARLSRLPRTAAIEHLVSLIGTAPEQKPAFHELTVTASRLIALLPRPCEPAASIDHTFIARLLDGQSAAFVCGIVFFFIYICILVTRA